MKQGKCIIWFRRDLRVHDNAALNWAIDNFSAVIPVYIYSPDEEQPWAPGGASRWWLYQSLSSLEKKLSQNGLVLNYFSGDSKQVISEIIAESGASCLAYNRLYEKHLYDRDQRIEQAFSAQLRVNAFDDGLFFTPGTILNNQQLPYRVYTPFYKKLRPMISLPVTDGHETGDTERVASATLTNTFLLDELGLLDEHRWYEKLAQHWVPGEDQAVLLLDEFIGGAVEHYDVERDLPAQDSTSRLSPYLHFGEITPQQILTSLWPLLQNDYGGLAAQSAEVFLKQLVWREFANHIMWHFPETASRPMNPRYHEDFWQYDEADFQAWCKGETGIPIIDAGMKQLWETGWMHNRVRMIVSSFLTKNLGMSWLDGARWFWDTLVDADLANNSMGWQWVAGCGVDAAPYYRIFNPEAQTKRFDEKLCYIDRWSPGHAELDYPQPMVDLASSREQALQRYKQHINP